MLPGSRPVNSRPAKRPGCVNTPMLSCVSLLCPAIIGTCRPAKTGNCERCLRPRSHVPVFNRPRADRTGESTTWNFKHLRFRPAGRTTNNAATKQSCMYSDLQWTVIQFLLCDCCSVVVNVDVTGCFVFIQKLKKKEDFGAFTHYLVNYEKTQTGFLIIFECLFHLSTRCIAV